MRAQLGSLREGVRAFIILTWHRGQSNPCGSMLDKIGRSFGLESTQTALHGEIVSGASRRTSFPAQPFAPMGDHGFLLRSAFIGPDRRGRVVLLAEANCNESGNARR